MAFCVGEQIATAQINIDILFWHLPSNTHGLIRYIQHSIENITRTLVLPTKCSSNLEHHNIIYDIPFGFPPHEYVYNFQLPLLVFLVYVGWPYVLCTHSGIASALHPDHTKNLLYIYIYI